MINFATPSFALTLMQTQELDRFAYVCPPTSFYDLTNHLHRQEAFYFAFLNSRSRKSDESSLLCDTAPQQPLLPQPGATVRLETMFPQLFSAASPVENSSVPIKTPAIETLNF